VRVCVCVCVCMCMCVSVCACVNAKAMDACAVCIAHDNARGVEGGVAREY